MMKTDRFLRLVTLNIQAGIGSQKPRHLITHGWRYLMPYDKSLQNLDRIAGFLADFDIVAIQEADAGSFRTRYVNQAKYIANKGGFSTCYSHIIRETGRIACHANSLISRLQFKDIRRHRLPASRHGRGLLEAHLQMDKKQIAVFVTHLSLRRPNRERQIQYLAEQINKYDSSILMGDLNCEPNSVEYSQLLRQTRLKADSEHPLTFPSWHPIRSLDHILATDDLALDEPKALPNLLSDHLPVSSTLTCSGLNYS